MARISWPCNIYILTHSCKCSAVFVCFDQCIDVNVVVHLIVMDNDTASESNKPVNERKTKNSAKISDDELILRRKRQNAERVHACRERKRLLVS